MAEMATHCLWCAREIAPSEVYRDAARRSWHADCYRRHQSKTPLHHLPSVSPAGSGPPSPTSARRLLRHSAMMTLSASPMASDGLAAVPVEDDIRACLPSALAAEVAKALPPVTSSGAASAPSSPVNARRGLASLFRFRHSKADGSAGGSASEHSSPTTERRPFSFGHRKKEGALTFNLEDQVRGLKKAVVDPQKIVFMGPGGGPGVVPRTAPSGEGATGIVFRALYAREGKSNLKVAVKVLKNPQYLTPQEREEWIREVTLLKKLKAPQIVGFVGIVAEPDRLWLVTDYVPGGTVKSALRKGPVAWPVRARIALDVARGLLFLHNHNIIHRDVKSANLLVVTLELTPHLVTTVKLIDFGASRIIKDESLKSYSKGIGTPIYMSPEVLQGSRYSISTDVFSYGVLLWELVTQQIPYEDFKTSWAVSAFVIGGSRLEVPPDTPPEIRELIEACWSNDPTNRPPASRVVSSLEHHVSALV